MHKIHIFSWQKGIKQYIWDTYTVFGYIFFLKDSLKQKVKSHKYLFLNKNRKKSSKIGQNSKYIYYNITSRDHSYDILTTRNRARGISHTIGYEIILRVGFVFHPRRGTLTIFSAWSLSSIYGISLDKI